MKPDKNTCLNCGKEISNRAKYCSDKCRKQYERNPDKKADKPNSDTNISLPGQPTRTNDGFRSTLTKTDKTFYDRAIKDFGEPYYDFTDNVRDSECLQCGEKFNTGLSLLKYCSYQHYSDAIKGKL